jgi:hypothetical protein
LAANAQECKRRGCQPAFAPSARLTRVSAVHCNTATVETFAFLRVSGCERDAGTAGLWGKLLCATISRIPTLWLRCGLSGRASKRAFGPGRDHGSALPRKQIRDQGRRWALRASLARAWLAGAGKHERRRAELQWLQQGLPSFNFSPLTSQATNELRPSREFCFFASPKARTPEAGDPVTQRLSISAIPGAR